GIRNPWPGMTRGFWGDRERYVDTYWSRFADVWVHSDWAYVDPEDDLWYVLGRSDDTIKIAGKRLGPAEVESVLVGSSAVAEAAAIGVPDELKGEALVCFVILRPGQTPSAELAAELQDLVAAALGKPLRPKAVHFVSDLPRTRNGKILRRVVRSIYTGKDPGDLSSLENPSALATSTPAGFAPFTAMWNGMLARVGSVGPQEVTISSPGTAPIMDSCCSRRFSGEAHPQGLGQAVPAVAGRDRPSADDARRAAS